MPGRCGEVVAAGDRAALVDAIERVLDDAEKRERMIRCGAERVRREFSQEGWVERMKELYVEAAR